MRKIVREYIDKQPEYGDKIEIVDPSGHISRKSRRSLTMTANEQLSEVKRELATFSAMLTEIQMRGVHEVKIDLIRTLLKPTEEVLRNGE